MVRVGTTGLHWSKAAMAVLLAFTCVSAGFAGGYLAVDSEGNPYKWAGGVTVNLDQGPLGRLTNAQADTMALESMRLWDASNIPDSAVQFIQAADLSEDFGDGSGVEVAPGYNLLTPPAGTTAAVIYDQTGALIDRQFGAGASSVIVGFAGPVVPDDFSPAPIAQGIAVLNGRFIDDTDFPQAPLDIPVEQYRGAFTHEIGHMLNLDHSQAALQYSETGIESATYYPEFGLGGGIGKEPDYRGRPTMFPFVQPDIETLELDDKAWISYLYPAATFASKGSISGTIRDINNNPVNGANIVAFNADDPTQMITCVSGLTDPVTTETPTGDYRIPGLPTGTAWVVDAEPVAGAFSGGSSLGRLDQPNDLPGAPEFLNELGIESQTDSAALSTAFMIPGAPANPNITTVDLRFNDVEDVVQVAEVENGSDETNPQVLQVTPGKYTVVNGFADPNEAGAEYVFGYGNFVDFFVVDAPAGLELNQIFCSGETHPVDLYVLEQDPTNPNGEFRPLTGTGSLTGPALSMYLDYSRMGTGVGAGKFIFAAVTPDPGFGGGTPGPTNYTFGVLFSVSDRDAVVVKGTEDGVVNPNSGVIRILGRGFKNLGGPPTVEFSAPGIQVDGVTFVDENTLDVAVQRLPDFQPGSSTAITVTNHPLSGGYAGRRSESVVAVPVYLSGFSLE